MPADGYNINPVGSTLIARPVEASRPPPRKARRKTRHESTGQRRALSRCPDLRRRSVGCDKVRTEPTVARSAIPDGCCRRVPTEAPLCGEEKTRTKRSSLRGEWP